MDKGFSFSPQALSKEDLLLDKAAVAFIGGVASAALTETLYQVLYDQITVRFIPAPSMPAFLKPWVFWMSDAQLAPRTLIISATGHYNLLTPIRLSIMCFKEKK